MNSPLNPAMVGCDLLCGGVSSAQNQANYSRYATAYFLAMLKDDPAASATLTASALSANTALRNTLVHDAPNCAIGSADGGADASADGASPPDVAMPPDGRTSDAPLDIATAPDVRNETGPDGSAPPRDAAPDAAVDVAAPPMTEPPASDAGLRADGSSRPSEDGATPGTTIPTGTNETASSGCDCSVVARRPASAMGSIAAGLLGLAAMCRRQVRRSRSTQFGAPVEGSSIVLDEASILDCVASFDDAVPATLCREFSMV